MTPQEQAQVGADPTPTPLSPAAQSVLDAWLSSERGQRMLGDPACLAAAFRAAASQMEFVQDVQCLLAIAAEMEGPAATRDPE